MLVNGWIIMVHPQFERQITALAAEVSERRRKNPAEYRKKNCTKKLAAIIKLAFETIPADPSSNAYRLGNTLGKSHSHWFRAKFFQQYRLFFRHGQHKGRKVLIYAWVNDDDTKRAYGSNTDAYKVFADMLAAEDPPTEWAKLVKACDEAASHQKSEGQQSLGDRLDSIRELIAGEAASGRSSDTPAG
jgi:toxin YhaV